MSEKVKAHGVVSAAFRAHVETTRAAAYRVVCAHPDPEAIHDFRVGLRRLRTVSRASRNLYGKRAMRQLEDTCKAFGDATGALRDAEVLADTLAKAELDDGARAGAATWLTDLQGREEIMRQRAVARICGPELEETFSALAERLRRGPKRDLGLFAYAGEGLAMARDGVVDRLPVPRSHPEHLHRLRIRFKRLRYTAEMLVAFGGALGEGKRARQSREQWGAVAKHASKMQSRLGLFNDAAQARHLLQTATIIPPDQRRSLERSLVALSERLEEKSLTTLEGLPETVAGPAGSRLGS